MRDFINMFIRLITLFSGYDSQALAMERLRRDFASQFDYDLVAWCEIDNNAINAHNAIFPQYKDRNLGDICKIDPKDVPDCDLITYSFPCQDISAAGNQKGFERGSGSRSSLLWECEKIISSKKPKYLLMENVKALTHRKFIPEFKKWIDTLDQLGYKTFYQVIDSLHMNIPQHRERVFAVSILRTEDNPNPQYDFPASMELHSCVEDYMEPVEDIDESYYVNRELITDKVLSDIINQPNVREELEQIYHEEWKEANSHQSSQRGGGNYNNV